MDQRTPGDGSSGDGSPGDGSPGDGSPGDGRPGDGSPGDGRPGDGSLGDGRPGDGSSGDRTVEIADGPTRWRFDGRFLGSTWSCIWGRGCLGIEAEPAPGAGLGCCSVGAEMGDVEEAMTVAALGATLDPDRFEHHDEAFRHGFFADGATTNTRVVDGACIFLNRPGFAGGAGCALHLAAVEAGESPIGWKPSVCWQLPIRVEWEPQPDGTEVATVRAWSRRDWGAEGQTMAWCCTEGDLAYGGDRPVVESLGEELAAIVGDDVYGELRRRMAGGATT